MFVRERFIVYLGLKHLQNSKTTMDRASYIENKNSMLSPMLSNMNFPYLMCVFSETPSAGRGQQKHTILTKNSFVLAILTENVF